jgi:hypothetical protein
MILLVWRNVPGDVILKPSNLRNADLKKQFPMIRLNPAALVLHVFAQNQYTTEEAAAAAAMLSASNETLSILSPSLRRSDTENYLLFFSP